MIWLSNEEDTPVDVYFDDFKVTQVKSPVIETSDYYPFGLRYNNYTRENALPNKLKLFQGQEHVDDLGLNWDSFKWRNHQPDIGRFFNVDPLSEKYYYNSPYAFSENKVVAHVELEGLESMDFNKATLEKNGKEIKFSAGSTIQKGDVSVDLTPTVAIGDGSVKISTEKSELKDDNPANKNKSASEIKAGSPDFDQKKLTDNILKNTTEAKEKATVQGPGKIVSKGTAENKELKVAQESKIKAEDQNAKAKAVESKKEPDNKENK